MKRIVAVMIVVVLCLSMFSILVPKVKASENLLTNPGFENGLTGWITSQGTAVYSPDSTTSYSGSSSAKGFETNTGSLGRLYQDVTAITVEGNQYQISAWIKTSNVIGTAVIALNYVKANGWTPGDGYVMDWIGTGGTTDWTFYQSPVFTLPAKPSDAVALWFLFDFNNGAGTVWWDDVSLVHTTPSQARLPLVGVKNVIHISDLDVGVGKKFSIQQNFCVRAQNPDKVFWAQNCMMIKETAGDFKAAAIFQIYDLSNPDDYIATSPEYMIDVDLTLYPLEFSLPNTLYFTSILSGGYIKFYNDYRSWLWKIPGDTPGNARIDYDPTPSRLSPEFVLVGPGGKSNADFKGAPDGFLESYVQLASQPWSNALVQNIAFAHDTQTAETSSGLGWTANGNNAGFFDLPGGNAEGVFYAPTVTATLAGGAATAVQGGLSVSIAGSSAPDGTSVVIAAVEQPVYQPSVALVGIDPPAYYDVYVQGISDGIATITITNYGILSQTTVKYFNGAGWVQATNVLVSGDKISGDIPVSFLTGTVIAIGPLSGVTVIFDQHGVDPHFAGTVVVIDGTPYEASALPLSFYWSQGSMHAFEFQSPLTVSLNTYPSVCTGTSGLSSMQSDTITVTTDGSVIGNYEIQPTSVGGEWIPTNGLQLLTLLMSLVATAAIAASFVGVRRMKRRQS